MQKKGSNQEEHNYQALRGPLEKGGTEARRPLSFKEFLVPHQTGGRILATFASSYFGWSVFDISLRSSGPFPLVQVLDYIS